MKLNFKSAVGGAAALSVAAGVMVLGAANANAAAPSFEPDANAAGTLSFYDASGTQITSGNINDASMAAFFVTNSAAPTGLHKAQTTYITPVDGTTPKLWGTGEKQSSSQTVGTTDALTSAPFPGAVATAAAAGDAVVADDAGVGLGVHITDFPSASAANPNIYQVRIYTNPGLAYWVADVSVNPASGAWTQVYPTVRATTSFSTIAANPVSPAAHNSSVTLSSTLSASDGAHPAGTVSLLDGTAAVPGATYNATTGAVSDTLVPADGAHSYTFSFVPTDTTNYNGTTSAALAYTVNAPAPAANTKTVVTDGTGAVKGAAFPITAAVTSLTTTGNSLPAGSPVTAGKVQFSLDGAAVGTPIALDSTGVATYNYIPADAGVAHVITAAFTPTDPTAFVASADTTGVTVTATTPAYNPDPQAIQVTVPAGTLVISTPYTAAHPFDLGTMVLSADGTKYTSAPVNFGDPAAAAAADPGIAPASQVTPLTAAQTANGVTITDTRAGSTGWKASAAVTVPFSDGAAHTIPTSGLSFTNVTPKFLTGNALSAANVTTQDITSFSASAQQFAKATAGPGTVNVVGKVSLTAPSSTIAGTYTATVTFSIV